MINQVFVYGSLKKGYGNHSLLSNGQFLGDAKIHGYEMVNMGAFPGIIPGMNSVKGEVYKVDEGVLRDLDYLEGYRPRNKDQSFYIRSVEDIPGLGPTYVYILNRPRSEFNNFVEPSLIGEDLSCVW